MTIQAKYENGIFRPLEDVKLKEGTRVDVYLPEDQRKAQKRPSIRDLGFAGMWTYRDDITSGVDYVNNLRDNPRGA